MSSWSSSTHTVSEMESHDISALITLSGAPLSARYQAGSDMPITRIIGMTRSSGKRVCLFPTSFLR